MAFDGEVERLMRDVSQRIILPRYRNLASGEVEDKAKDGEANDPVTIADRESEEALRAGLEKIMPGLAVVGEEAAHEDVAVLERLSGDCWIIDPLDGTRNFASGKPPFGILLAMASGGEAHTGWILDCLTGRFCIAHRGKGAWVDGERVQARETGQDQPVAAISFLFMDAEERVRVQQHIAPHYTLTDIPYCAAEQYPRLALGENDVSIFERTLAWDHAAGVLWLNEAGGKAARPNGDAYRVDEKGRTGLIGAASSRLWDGLAERLAAMA
ncbi:inositol monophosphatase family protein [Paraurantiacibacter namhicola]|uniref:Inositol-1-monophosphatase n=1 Tax=Paraurantiacibacter namhicola TaxID=645517 RepID=A0A1C7D9R5_9SPHN|nr:inositol monophosphatase family protein [Paraurantiacibacter namhicola]ANU08175.1 Inositol-1-monophosphatase [Paraurantiacibacter namhicola]